MLLLIERRQNIKYILNNLSIYMYGVNRFFLKTCNSSARCLCSLCQQLHSEYPLKLHCQIPCVFPVRRQFFPVPIYVICDYYIHKTDLADLASFNYFWEIFAAYSEISFTLRFKESGNLQLEQTKFPVLAKFQNSLCFP